MILLLDIDDTISDAAWREHLLPQNDQGSSWDLYHSASVKDEPIEDVAQLVRSLKSAGWAIVGITGRSEKWRSMTVSWLFKHDVPIDELLMRPNDDYRKIAVVKMEQMEPYLQNGGLLVAMDDNEHTVSAYRERNITVMHVFVKRNNT